MKLLCQSTRWVLPHTVIRQPGLLQLLLKVIPSASAFSAASDLSTPTTMAVLPVQEMKVFRGPAADRKPRALSTQ